MLRVFISSTFEDLYDYRQAVKEAVLGYEWLPVNMENFGATPDSTIEGCCREVVGCDLFVLLVGFRRGFVPDRSRGGDGIRSITAWETESAKRNGIPMLVFLAEEKNWPRGRCDTDPESCKWVEEFRGRLDRLAVSFGHELVPRDARPQVPPNFFSLARQQLGNYRDRLFQDLRKTLGQPTAVPHMRAALKGLERLCDKAAVPREAIHAAYREAHPRQINDLPRHGDSVMLAATAATRLSMLPRSSQGRYPLLVFIDQIVQHTQGSQRTLFARWHNEVADMLDRPQQPQHRVGVAATAHRSDKTTHVLVHCEPSTIAAKKMLVQAWIYEDGQRRGLPVEKDPWTETNRAEMLGRLFQEVMRRTTSQRKPVFEFLVPRSCISEDFDQWEMLLEEGVIRIGEYCPVVVRFLERCHLTAKRSLSRRWDQIEPCLKDPCHVVTWDDFRDEAAPAALWLSQNRSGDMLFKKLSLQETVACVVLRACPKETSTAKRKDLFQALLFTGVPFGLWPRKYCRDARKVEQELLGLLKQQPLEDLPWRVLKHRLSDSSQSLTRDRLTLVWDDPTRVPPEACDEPPLGLEIHNG